MVKRDETGHHFADSQIHHDERWIFHYASELRDRGMSTLPLKGKRPVMNWKVLQSRLPTRDEIATWFGGESPKHTNIGIVTGGISGLIVVDCDSPEAADRWRTTHQQTPLACTTGRLGMHFYYRLPAGTHIGNRVRINGDAIDIRSEGGYVVCPPSRHPNGRLYTWTGALSSISADDIPYFDPTWLPKDASPSTVATTKSPVRSNTAPVIRNARAYIKHIYSVSGSGGHSQAFRAACKLRDAGLTPEQALAELVLWNQTNASPPWSVHELLKKCEDAFAAARPCQFD